MRRSMLAAALLAAVLAPPPGARAARPSLRLDDRVALVDDALSRWDVARAEYEVERLLAEHGEDARALLAAARTAFHAADYDRMQDLAERAAAAAKPGTDAAHAAEALAAYLEERRPTWDSFSEHRSEHFVLRVSPRDELLVPYALDALERSAGALDRLLGYCPADPVVVEVYPNRRSFIAASSLTREEVETSGTVAICHFNRIMILSPAVMSRGYDWLDTLCHEYVHHVVYHVGEDTIPVWLHEGIARVLQHSWITGEPEGLDPHASSLLAEGRQTGTWVTFEQMHPSMAKLPSAALVSLAFAEVASAVRMVLEDGGPAELRGLVDAVRDHGGDVDAALRASRGVGFGEFEQQVRRHVDRQALTRIPGTRFLTGEDRDPREHDFQDEGEASDPEDDVAELEDRKARDWTTLGDRLKGRGHHEAALIEYDKALGRLGHAEPMVVNKKAHALLEAGRPADALPLLEAVLRDFPELTTTLDNLAEIHLRLAAVEPDRRTEHVARALELAQRSERMNPFNPDTHVRLASVYERLGRTAQAQQSRQRLQQVLEVAR